MHIIKARSYKEQAAVSDGYLDCGRQRSGFTETMRTARFMFDCALRARHTRMSKPIIKMKIKGKIII